MVIFKITAAFLFASVKSGGVITIDEDSRMLLKQEAEFARKHKHDTDEELIEYLKCCAEKLKSCPKKNDVIGHTYLKQRLGPWPRILERAGLKEKSQKRIEKEQKMNWSETSKSVVNHASINRRNQQAEKKLKKELKKPERVMLEELFEKVHSSDTDEELFNYVKEQKKKFGKQLSPITTIGYTYIVKRFGSWAYIMGQINKKLKEENNERIELK